MEGEASGSEAEPSADAGRVEQSVAKWPKEVDRVGCDAWIRGGTRRGKHAGLSGAVVVNGTQHGLRRKASGGRSLPWPLSTPHSSCEHTYASVLHTGILLGKEKCTSPSCVSHFHSGRSHRWVCGRARSTECSGNATPGWGCRGASASCSAGFSSEQIILPSLMKGPSRGSSLSTLTPGPGTLGS